jgi:hypothetical protein
MIMIYETLALAFVALIAPVFAKYAGYELRRKPFELVGTSGLFFLLSIAFGVLPIQYAGIAALWSVVGIICYFIGWITMLVGVVWELIDVLAIPESMEHSEVRSHEHA